MKTWQEHIELAEEALKDGGDPVTASQHLRIAEFIHGATSQTTEEECRRYDLVISWRGTGKISTNDLREYQGLTS